MRFKLTRELCYISGLSGRHHWPERSRVGIRTSSEAVEQRFVELAIRMGVEPSRMLIKQDGGLVSVSFYHSKMARMVREVMEMRADLAGKGRGLAEAFVAGTFDASGHVAAGKVSIRGLQRSDELLLERMGIHTASGKVLNIGAFVRLAKGMSVLLAQSGLGAETSVVSR